MKIEITGEPKEIAALVLAVQERQVTNEPDPDFIMAKRIIERSTKADCAMTAKSSSENFR